MAANYLDFFDLNDDPFRMTPDIHYFYNSPEHSTALLSLEYCFKEKEGFCLLTGEPGTGKTTLMRLFVDKWKDRAEIALIMTPRLSPEEFFLAVLEDFKIPLISRSKNDQLKAFRDFLLTHAANDRRVAIIVDEAQQLPDTTLEELRLLSNLETEKEKLLQIILIGQPELRTKLGSQLLRQLNQRISVRVQLKPLNEVETSDYINTRLIRAGNSTLFANQKAKALIFKLSGGKPRRINLLSTRALMSAFLEGTKEVTATHVRKGAADVMESEMDEKEYSAAAARRRTKKNWLFAADPRGKASSRTPMAMILGILFLIAAGYAFYYFGYARPTTTLLEPVVTRASAPPLSPNPAAVTAGRISSATQSVQARQSSAKQELNAK
ncbi:MAG: AAA family ATPase [Desulfuromonadaceae bacterium]|nr:AAA family ATPase [Desulfuromonadaceae bacterium]